MRRKAAALVLATMLVGCATPPIPQATPPTPTPAVERPAGARRTRIEALRIAAKALGNRAPLRDVTTSFATASGKGIWIVRLPSPKNAPIGGGSVEIDDATGKATVRYGK